MRVMAAFLWARELVFTISVFTRLKTVSKPTPLIVKSCLQVVNSRKKIVLPLITNMADDEILKGKQVFFLNFMLFNIA